MIMCIRRKLLRQAQPLGDYHSFLFVRHKAHQTVRLCRCEIMARSIDESFYKTPAWRRCRAAYLKQHPVCERCAASGLVTPSVYVHHRIHLTPENVKDPALAYGDSNLEALCFECHEQEHRRRKKRRYRVDDWGRVTEG